MKLAPGASATATFVLTWHLPNLKLNRLPPGRHYATRFASALAVAQYVARAFRPPERPNASLARHLV